MASPAPAGVNQAIAPNPAQDFLNAIRDRIPSLLFPEAPDYTSRRLERPRPFHREGRIRMKKKSEKKLVLNREIVRELSKEETRNVLGGEYTYTCDSCACNW
jgi:hypothetical protein